MLLMIIQYNAHHEVMSYIDAIVLTSGNALKCESYFCEVNTLCDSN